MEHQTAVELRFPERYLLNELSPEETASFEAHFLDCALCADEVRQGAHLVANLKAVLQEDIREQIILPGTKGPTEIRLSERFLDLTFVLNPLESAPRISCEFHFAESPAPLVMAALASDGSVRLRLPSDCFPPGACSVVLWDEDSRRQVGQHQLRIAKSIQPQALGRDSSAE